MSLEFVKIEKNKFEKKNEYFTKNKIKNYV